MALSLDAKHVYQHLGRADWLAPKLFGSDGLVFARRDGTGSLIASVADLDGVEWIHGSIAYDDRMPTYEDLCLLHRAVFDRGWAYQVFAPETEHVDIHRFALHLWGRLDGAAALPDFTRGLGTV